MKVSLRAAFWRADVASLGPRSTFRQVEQSGGRETVLKLSVVLRVGMNAPVCWGVAVPASVAHLSTRETLEIFTPFLYISNK